MGALWRHILLGVPLAFPDPPLAAGGIVLRTLEPRDVPWVTAACSDRELSRYVPGIPYPYAEADARAFIERAARAWAEGWPGRLAAAARPRSLSSSCRDGPSPSWALTG